MAASTTIRERLAARAIRRPRSVDAWQRDRRAGYLFIAPQLLGFTVFVLGPLLAVAWFSLHDWDLLTGRMDFVGAGNYQQLVGDPTFHTVARNTAVFALGVVPFTVVLGLVLALLVNQRIHGRVLFRTVFFLPVVVSLVAWTIVWDFLLQADGGVNQLLLVVGVEGPNWLRRPGLAMTSVVVVQGLKSVGLAMIFFLAALQEVPRELEEAAMIDGADPLARFRHITLPMIAPTTFFVLVLSVIGSLKIFEQIYLLTGGGPGISTTVLVYYVYNQAFQYFDGGYASAIAVVLFLVVLALTVTQWRLRRRWVFHES